MKKLFLLTVVALGFAFQATGQNDAISKYFDQYMNDERFNMVYVSPKMFELAARMDIESDDLDPEVVSILEELKGLRVLSYEGNEGSENEALQFYKEAREKIDINSYEELLVARDGDENVHILVTSEGDIVSELLMLIGGKDEFTMLSFVGNIDLKKVGKLANMLDINGMEHLNKVEEN